MRTIEEIARLLCLCGEAGEKCLACPNNEDEAGNRRCRDFRQYEAAKEAIKLSQEWTSVEEEYPDDGTVVLLKNNQSGIPVVGMWMADGFISCETRNRLRVSHWRKIEIE
jgi:hypothetical protein